MALFGTSQTGPRGQLRCTLLFVLLVILGAIIILKNQREDAVKRELLTVSTRSMLEIGHENIGEYSEKRGQQMGTEAKNA